jgi:predicted RNA-binding Zn-ribbon protein involved in translation (DUF1610 family)
MTTTSSVRWVPAARVSPVWVCDNCGTTGSGDPAAARKAANRHECRDGFCVPAEER